MTQNGRRFVRHYYDIIIIIIIVLLFICMYAANWLGWLYKKKMKAAQARLLLLCSRYRPGKQKSFRGSNRRQGFFICRELGNSHTSLAGSLTISNNDHF